MTKYRSDLLAIEQSAIRIAQFYKVAFHCHSPLSHDWANGNDNKALNGKGLYLGVEDGVKNFYDAIQTNCDSDVIVITDHMKSDFGNKLSIYSVGQKTKPLILPGMEVSIRTSPALASVRIHVVLIMPPDSNLETFAPLLIGLPKETERNGKEEIEVEDIKKWIKQVRDHGGICIAAHVESSSGIRSEFRQTAKNIIALQTLNPETQTFEEKAINKSLTSFLFEFGFDAIEIQHKEHRKYYRITDEENNPKTLTAVTGLDAHCLEKYNGPRTTMVKMTQLGINGLKDALKFPETRIRFSDEIITPPSPKILGVSIKGGPESFFEDLTVAFSENLNCIIGPRGAGKSTLLEAFRYVFGYNRTLTELDQTNKLSGRILDLQKANLYNSLIQIHYELSDGNRRILEATYDPKQPYTTKVYDTEGNYISVDDIERSGDYPFRLYGWSEIETLGRDATRQRTLLDRMIPEIEPASQNKKDAVSNLESSRRAIEDCISDLNQSLEFEDGLIYKYKEYEEDFRKMNSEEIKVFFENIDDSLLKKKVYDTIAGNITTTKSQLDTIGKIEFKIGVSDTVKLNAKTLQEWWISEELRDKTIVQTEQHINASIEDIKSKVTEIQDLVAGKSTEWEQRVEDLYTDLRDKLSDDSNRQKIADLRRNAKSRLDKVKVHRDGYLEIWQKLQILLKNRKTLLTEYESCQNQITGIRARKIDSIQEKLGGLVNDKLKIDINLRPAGDKIGFSTAIHSFLKSRNIRADKKMMAAIVKAFIPPKFCSFILSEKIDDMVKACPAITSNQASKVKENCSIKEQNSSAEVDVLCDHGKTLIDVLKLQESIWDDHESITLNGTSVDKLSPGQRSSAMLPLISLAEKAPLMIDQPEDNLDNRLVGDLLVDILAELKETRQLIVCTHNPNIVVSGDAEQVIVLDSESNDKGELLLAGSIDNDDVVNSVIDIMEGGRQAFKVRRKRYNL